MFDAVIFDLDGTLVDSAPEIHRCVTSVLAQEGLPPLPFDTVRGFIGGGVSVLMERVIRACGLPPEKHRGLCDLYERIFHDEKLESSLMYQGVEQALDALFPLPLGICTNKPVAQVQGVMDWNGWNGRFKVIVGGDTLPVRKPDPAPLREAIRRMGGKDVLFVGDSEVDAETAQAAGVPFLLFTGGYRSAPVVDLPHAGSFDAWRDMPDAVRRVSGALRRGR